MTEDQQQELVNARALAQKLIQLNDNNLAEGKKKEHAARRSAFAAGMFALVIPFMLYLVLDSKVFDEQLDVFIEDHKWAQFLMVGMITACWQGMQYLAVKRHDPERKKK